MKHQNKELVLLAMLFLANLTLPIPLTPSGEPYFDSFNPWKYLPPNDYNAANPRVRLRFTPVDYEWQLSKCTYLGLKVRYNLNEYWPRTGNILTRPKEVLPMSGEINCCFWRAISFHVTGSVEDYMAIRAAVFKYMRRYMVKELGKDYINYQSQHHIGAHPVEMAATARLLKTPIYVTEENWGYWGQFLPNEAMKDVDNVPRIYIQLIRERHHAQVVSSVW